MKKLITGVLMLFVLCSLANGLNQQPISNPQFRESFLDKINQVRARGCDCGSVRMRPAPPLVWNDQLEIAAIGHARDMANLHYFAHSSSDGRTMQDRIRNAGYTFDGFRSYSVGENIAEGPNTIAEVMNGWFKSPGHCKNLMNPEFKEVGVSEVEGYWVQDFGGRESFSPEVQKKIKSGQYHLVEKQ